MKSLIVALAALAVVLFAPTATDARGGFGGGFGGGFHGGMGGFHGGMGFAPGFRGGFGPGFRGGFGRFGPRAFGFAPGFRRGFIGNRGFRFRRRFREFGFGGFGGDCLVWVPGYGVVPCSALF